MWRNIRKVSAALQLSLLVVLLWSVLRDGSVTVALAVASAALLLGIFGAIIKVKSVVESQSLTLVIGDTSSPKLQVLTNEAAEAPSVEVHGAPAQRARRITLSIRRRPNTELLTAFDDALEEAEMKVHAEDAGNRGRASL